MLTVSALTKVFGGFTAVNRVSFTVAAGESSDVGKFNLKLQ